MGTGFLIDPLNRLFLKNQFMYLSGKVYYHPKFSINVGSGYPLSYTRFGVNKWVGITFDYPVKS